MIVRTIPFLAYNAHQNNSLKYLLIISEHTSYIPKKLFFKEPKKKKRKLILPMVVAHVAESSSTKRNVMGSNFKPKKTPSHDSNKKKKNSF